MTLAADDHPRLRFGAFFTTFTDSPETSPQWLIDLLALDAQAPLQRDEDVRKAVRDVLRFAGHKPTGRGKPASEYLVRAAGDGYLGTINLPVDACNAVSLHSGLPISVVDVDLALPPYRIGVPAAGTSYVFNASGQEISLKGLLCLHDAEGACANGVKDSQRTKTSATTRRTLSVLWGSVGYEERLEQTVAWYRELLERAGAQTSPA